MRTAFVNQLIKEAEQHPDIFLIIGDLGFNVVEEFANKFPDRFLNAGIAEQNMIGVAAGLAKEGYNVYVYSIANFPTLRCIEQIRYDVCYHNLSVKVVAVGAGYAYGSLGSSHHATEEMGMMRTIPNLVVASPGDPIEAKAITTLSANYQGPMYLRLGKAGEKQVHTTPFDNINIGDIIPVTSSEGIMKASEAAKMIKDSPRAKKFGILQGKYNDNDYITSSTWDAIPIEVGKTYIMFITDRYYADEGVYAESGRSFLFEVEEQSVYSSRAMTRNKKTTNDIVSEILAQIEVRTGRADEVGVDQYMIELGEKQKNSNDK